MRAYHEKYGFGTIIKDVEGQCLEHEVLFKPDGGIFDRTSGSGSKYAHFVPDTYDIFEKSKLEIFNKK